MATRTATKTAARKKRRQSHKGRQRTDDLKNYWLIKEKPLRFGDDEWRVIALRGKGTRPVDVSDFVQSVSWVDSGPILTGTVTLMKPDAAPKFDLGDGHVLRLDWRRQSATRWVELWRMRVGGPLGEQAVSINVKDGSVEYQLANDLALVAKSNGSFNYRSDKRHKGGWRASQVIVDVCRQWSIPHFPIPVMSHKIKKLAKSNTSPLDFLQMVIAQHNNYEHGDFIMRWRAGKLEIVRKQRSAHMLTMTDTMIDATLTTTRRADFATVLDVHATTDNGTGKDSKGKKKHKKRKINTRVTQQAYVRRYGLIRRSVRVQATSVAEARRKGRALIAKMLRPQQDVTFTHPGIPSLARNHAITVSIPEYDYRKLLYVVSVTHNLQPGDYSMDVTVRSSDPFADHKKKVKAKKCAAASKRKRTHPKDCKDVAKKKPKPKKHKQRSSSKVGAVRKRTAGQQLSDRAYK